MTAFSDRLTWLRHSRKMRVCCVILALLLLLVLSLGAYVLLDPYGCRMADGVSVCGLDVGGMTPLEARKALKSAAEASLLSQDLTVELPRQTLSLSPEDTRVTLKILPLVWDAYQIGRSTDTETEGFQILSLMPYLSLDGDFVRQLLQDYALRYDTTLSESCCALEGDMPDLSAEGFDPAVPCPTLKLTLGTPEAHLDVHQAYAEILAVYSRAFSAVEDSDYLVSIEVIPEAVPQEPNLDAIFEELCVSAANDTLDMQTYEIIPGSYGCAFDLDAAKDAAAQADWGETLSLPMVYSEPEILGEEVYFQDVLGTCETRHTDDENRNTNLRLVCEILDGFVLQPGEEFSYNGVIGERTEERGFKSAGAYSGNRLVKDIGGGVCQGSSTLYNCVLLADLEVTERVCHGFTVNYLPIGLDAAVNWATKTDFKFRNNFHFPIKIQAEVSDGYMKMKILGTDEKDYYIEMKSGRSDEEQRIYSNSYKYKYDKETGELISKELEARSAYMYFTS